MSLFTRRAFLKLGTLAAGALLGGNTAFAAVAGHLTAERKIYFYNTHTGETLDSVFWANGEYLPEALVEINHILRDYRTDEIKRIDPSLLDILYSVRKRLGSREPFHIISGYRSAETNALLRRTSTGIARNSLHIEGKAIDIRLPGCESRTLWKAALELRAGGVGFYRSSDFVHLDTGRVRRWHS